MKRPPTVCLVSLGCAKNLVDAEVMCGSLATSGFALTNDPDHADIMVVNTCSFIADARAEANDEIRAGLRWKKARRGRLLVVTGCLPQREPQATREAYPGIDLLLGLDDVADVGARLLQRRAGGDTPALPSGNAPSYLYDHQTPRLLLTPPGFAYVKIAEGCDHHCTFCAIPAIRGRQRSRSLDSVLQECRNLLDQGVRELNLIAQDTTRYGIDRSDGANLAALLRACDRLDGDFWIRLLYTHPRFFGNDLLDVYADAAHLVPYIDIPLQHIADSQLRAMGRHFGEDDTRGLMDRIRARLPNAVIRTTFLVGFPGETDDDYERLLTFVRDVAFDRLGAFAFSPEDGTPAAAMTDGIVPHDIAVARRDNLLAVQQEIALAKNRALVGATVDVLIDAITAPRTYVGRTRGDAPDVDNQVHCRSRRNLTPGDIVQVAVTEAGPYDLHGTVRISGSPPPSGDRRHR